MVDLRSALLVGLDSVHTAGGGAGALHFIDSAVGTDSRAASALYALRLIYYRFAVNYLDSFLGTDFLTRVSKAALAAVGNVVVGFGTSVAGKLDDIYQRRIVVFFSDSRFLNALRNRLVLVDGTQRQTDRQAQALFNYRALKKYRLAVDRLAAGHDLVRQVADLRRIIAALVSQTCHFGKHLAAYISYRRVDSSHFHTNILLFCFISVYLARRIMGKMCEWAQLSIFIVYYFFR